MNVVFVDTETTGLDPDRHEIWEVGLVYQDDKGVWTEFQAFLPVDLGRADFRALKIGGFHDRYKRPPQEHVAFQSVLSKVEEITRGKHLAGAVVSFDEERLRRLFQRKGFCPGWHYHLVDVESFAAGCIGLEPPWNSDELSWEVGVNPTNFDRHTATGDAWWAKAIYDKVLEEVPEES